jgi:N-formylglutamate amidohydrolase
MVKAIVGSFHFKAIADLLRQLSLNLSALTVADTDRHLNRLYDFASQLGATVLGATMSRYVIDLNRPPNDESLYPGQTTTGVCPDRNVSGRGRVSCGMRA